MKSFGLFALAGLAIAEPLVLKRDVVWVTQMETVYATDYVTSTVWVDGHDSAATPAAVPSSTISIAAIPTSDTTLAHAVGPAASSADQTVAAASSLSSPAPVVPVAETIVSSDPLPQTTAPASQPLPATSVAQAPTSEAAPPVAATTPTSSAAPPPPATSSPAPAQSSTPPAGSDSEGMAASGKSYTGDLTWYDVGLGACGLTSTPGEYVVAVSKDLFDDPQYATANPNANKLCGRTVNIASGGQTMSAKVVDRCVGCAVADLDLSNGLFSKFATPSTGRLEGVTWTWQ